MWPLSDLVNYEIAKNYDLLNMQRGKIKRCHSKRSQEGAGQGNLNQSQPAPKTQSHWFNRLKLQQKKEKGNPER
jgi:hypothetical protein